MDGYVSYMDLADVVGKKELTIKYRLKFLRLICMKNFGFQLVNEVEQVVLNSKKCLCQCKSCGAPIEKRIYFTGTCSYCDSSDLFAKIITNNRFYCINNNVSQGIKKPDYYIPSNLKIKNILYIIIMSVSLMVTMILTLYLVDNITKYNDMDYLRKVLLSGKSYSSYDLIKKEMRDNILFTGIFIIALLPALVNNIRKILYIFKAQEYSNIFAKYKTPYIKAKIFGTKNKKTGKNNGMKAVRVALKRRYLINCNIEKHNGVLVVALAKKNFQEFYIKQQI